MGLSKLADIICGAQTGREKDVATFPYKFYLPNLGNMKTKTQKSFSQSHGVKSITNKSHIIFHF